MNQFIKILFFLTIITSFFSCERDILIFHNRVLKGKWKWIRSETRSCYYHCTLFYTDTTTPSSTGIERIIDFKRKGKMYVFENGEKIIDAVINLKNKNTNWNDHKISYFSFIANCNATPTPYRSFSGKIFGNMDTLVTYYSHPGSYGGTSSYYVRIE